MAEQAEIGIIGGSGLYAVDGMSDIQEVDLDTPFGKPSDVITVGTLENRRVAFVPRHGRGHRLLPSEVPVRANVYALKSLGVQQIISVSAVGSLKEDLRPMDMVVPDQIFDRTRGRPSTFFGDGLVAHIGFSHPFCGTTCAALSAASKSIVERTHSGGTYVCIEGPAFSTYAESVTYRALNFDVIGMTALPEAKLAREAQICYALLAQVTDYDCWRESSEVVTGDLVMQNVARNVANARDIIRSLLPALDSLGDCDCRHALRDAVVTSPERMSPSARDRLDFLLGRASSSR